MGLYVDICRHAEAELLTDPLSGCLGLISHILMHMGWYTSLTRENDDKYHEYEYLISEVYYLDILVIISHKAKAWGRLGFRGTHFFLIKKRSYSLEALLNLNRNHPDWKLTSTVHRLIWRSFKFTCFLGSRIRFNAVASQVFYWLLFSRLFGDD